MCFKKKDKPAVSSSIDLEIRNEKKQGRTPVLLLLGAGNAGKTTFCRQLLHMNPSARQDEGRWHNIIWVEILRDNTLQSAKVLFSEVQGSDGKWDIISNSVSLEMQNKILEATALDLDIAKALEALGTEQIDKVLDEIEACGKVIMCSGAFGAKRFFRNASNYCTEGYDPTHDDIICARKRTSGVHQFNLQFQGRPITVVDVGGQKSERRKWVDQFQTATAILYLVAINEYDQTLEEEARENRLVDSIKMFTALSSSCFLKDKPFVLFLNKSDLFERKIAKVPLEKVFEGYEEFERNSKTDDKFQNGWKFFAAQFTAKFGGQGVLAVHLTSAVNSDSCKSVWKAVATQFVLSYSGPML